MEIKYRKFNNPRDRRLAIEHELLHEFCKQSKLVSYEVKKRKGGLPPDRYIIHYNVRSIVEVDSQQQPVYGDFHKTEIIIPAEYPLGGQPSCYMLTKAWHPNIKHDGRFAGKICVNKDALGHWHTLDMMAERIGEMLQYKNYHAQNTHPYPEDSRVALWVREFAEPHGIVNKNNRIYTDDRPLLETTQEWLDSRKKKIELTVKGTPLDAIKIIKLNELSTPQKTVSVPNQNTAKGAIKIIKAGAANEEVKKKNIIKVVKFTDINTNNEPKPEEVPEQPPIFFEDAPEKQKNKEVTSAEFTKIPKSPKPSKTPPQHTNTSNTIVSTVKHEQPENDKGEKKKKKKKKSFLKRMKLRSKQLKINLIKRN